MSHTFGLGKHYNKLQAMKSTVNAMWPLFDVDGSGSIEIDEFTASDGHANCIIANIGIL